MAQMTELQQRLSEIRRDDPEVWLQSDETGVVHVSVDGTGAVDVVSFAQNWWQRVRPEDAGALVLSLVRASAAARGQTATELGADERAARTEPEAPAPAPLGGGADDRTRLTSRLTHLLTAFSQLDDYRRSVTEAARESVELRSPSGTVVMQVVGAMPRSLTIDSANAAFTPERQLEAEIVDLFARARTRVAEREQQALGEHPELLSIVRAVHAREGR